MAIQDQQEFIKGLAGEQRRRRPLPRPSRRAFLWFALALVLSAALMVSVQVFRPGLADQFLQHPIFLVEVVGALLFSGWGAYVAMVRATPGERLSRASMAVATATAVLFAVGMAGSFTHLAPESTADGARHACFMEVIIYGAICLLLFVLMVRRGFVRYSWKLGLLYGIVAGLVPAALMQLACMYDPMHGLIFHYLPIVVLVPVGLLAMRLVRK